MRKPSIELIYHTFGAEIRVDNHKNAHYIWAGHWPFFEWRLRRKVAKILRRYASIAKLEAELKVQGLTGEE